MLTKRYSACVIVICAVTISLAGCRNRFNQPCNSPYQQPYMNQYGYNAVPNAAQPFGVAGRSPVIPPPATGTLNIPSLARNNPFGVNQNRGLLNTNQAAPTPANRSARINAQNGWQAVDGNNNRPGPQTNNGQSGQQNGSTTLGSNTTQGAPGVNSGNAPSNARSVLVQDTQSRANQGYGDSYVRSPDYSTTAMNETFDRTRLPATDASAVRAPSQYYARATGVQVAQVPQQFVAGAGQPYYSATFARPGQPVPYNVAPGVIQPGRPVGLVAVNTGAVVQDQGTATYDPYSNTRSADWRNRDISSGTFQ